MNSRWARCLCESPLFKFRRLPEQTRSFSNSFSLRQPRLSIRESLNRWKNSGSTAGGEQSFVSQFPRPGILRPIAVAVGLGSTIYFTCLTLDSLVAAEWSFALARKNIFGERLPSEREMLAGRIKMQQAKYQARFDAFKEWTKDWPAPIAFHFQRLYVIVANSWLLSFEASQTAYKITALNTLIFLAWRIPRLRPLMNRSFLHDPLSGRSYTMLTSVFSHASLPHLFFNSMALISFAPAVFSSFFNHDRSPIERDERPPPRATSIYHFTAFFATAGIASSLLSHIVTARFRLPRLLSNLADPAKAASAVQSAGLIKPSLGASGAIYAMVVMTAFTVPHSAVNIMFIPIAIPIATAVSATVCLDILGIVRGWQMFDHWAHLGGAAFGALYYWKGLDLWDNLRREADKDTFKLVKERRAQMVEQNKDSEDDEE
ncbi:hypothetical protein FRC02_003786 [Tulasnella sp. 418]|nr:hypothetical protein FRC02_003786 [Tulasnella sp. 418]